MKIATVLNVHSQPETVLDTLEAIQQYVSKDILVIVDGASKDFKSHQLPVPTVEGFPHGIPRSPYRNVALGLSLLVEEYPDADWYLYTEYDCLFTSDRFKLSLKKAQDMGVWMMGSDGHVDDKQIPLIDPIIKGPMKSIYYLIGCCQFFYKDYIQKLLEINFFERFLHVTNQFTEGYVPGYFGYDVSEHMYPSMARHFGGNVGVFSSWDAQEQRWHGNYQDFPIRWKPELDPDTENYPNACIMHPLKTFDHPIRVQHRNKRKHAIQSA